MLIDMEYRMGLPRIDMLQPAPEGRSMVVHHVNIPIAPKEIEVEIRRTIAPFERDKPFAIVH